MPPTSPPRTIVTNDDGIDSEGLWHLAAVAVAAGLDVLVAAPVGEASGSGSAIKASQDHGQVQIQRRELPAPAQLVPAYAIRATPAFIVFAAARGAFGGRPRYVLSGINRGPNTGRAVLHSGTVAAAMTATGYGLPAVAFSLDVHEQSGTPEWETAAAVAAEVLRALPEIPGGVVLNVNVPNVPPGRLRGIRHARLASFGAVQTIVPSSAADGYLQQVNVSEQRDEPELGSDSAALAAGYASVTPLRSVCEVAPDGLPWQPEQAPA
jgi:5'-nucleotidase